MTPDVIKVYQKEANHALSVLENVFLADDKNNRGGFLLGTSHPTAADFMAYEEIIQLWSEFCNLHSLVPYPNIRAWLCRMKDLPFHDAVHAALKELGDFGGGCGSSETTTSSSSSTKVADRILPATKIGLKAIKIAMNEHIRYPTAKL
jgi:hypothetical protein